MTRLPELHRQLVRAARRQEEVESEARRISMLGAESGRSRLLALALSFGTRRAGARARTIDAAPAHPSVGASGLRRGLRGRLRAPLLALIGLLASTTIALAAGGVIGTGSPVRPAAPLNPRVGLGVPAMPDEAGLLPLCVPDPSGGLPWGMRIVRTTRQEVCLQVGRVEHGRLGELGIDGAFQDDRLFHPLPADALPTRTNEGGAIDQNTHCEPNGSAFSAYSLGVDRAAQGERNDLEALPRSDLRDVYYGLLGPSAVSVSYREDGAVHSDVAGSGAYLIVTQMPARTKPGYYGAGVTSYGALAPSRPLVAIAYRDGRSVCERGVSLRTDAAGHVARPCPPSSKAEPSRSHPHPALHVPVHVHLHIAKRVVVGATVSFAAPYAVESAHGSYEVVVPQCVPSGVGKAFTSQSIERDARRGAIVSEHIGYPFANGCRDGRRAKFEVRYAAISHPNGTLVGERTLRQPPGTLASRPVEHGSPCLASLSTVGPPGRAKPPRHFRPCQRSRRSSLRRH